MGMQLRIALPARSVHEPGHHPTLRGYPPPQSLRLHPGHRRVRSSKNPDAASTASRCAAATASASGSEANAHNTDTLFGAENVKSNALTWRGRDPASRSSPLTGCLPSTKARSSPASTTPAKPSPSDHRPAHTPGDSPTPA